jgi:hypothetical protein
VIERASACNNFLLFVSEWLSIRRDAAIDSIVADAALRLLTLAATALLLLASLPPFMIVLLAASMVAGCVLWVKKKSHGPGKGYKVF